MFIHKTNKYLCYKCKLHECLLKKLITISVEKGIPFLLLLHVTFNLTLMFMNNSYIYFYGIMKIAYQKNRLELL